MRDELCVLVVDDAPDVRLLVRTVLSRHGWEVLETDSGVDACALLRQRRVSVVLLDVQIPQQDGWTTLAQIRQHPDTVDVPVVMCTVKSRRPDRLHAWTLGCDGFVTKPFAINDLVAELTAVVARTASERLAIRNSNLATLSQLEEAR